jgi:hypothetical protein
LQLNPLRDDQGVIPHDDPAIAADSYIVRHINPLAHVYPDEATGKQRISSGAFNRTRGPRGGMSVDIGQLLAEDGKPLGTMVPPGMGAVKLRTGAVRDLGLWVGSDPVVPANPYHGQVWKFSNRTPRDLQRAVEDWVVPLPGVVLR